MDFKYISQNAISGIFKVIGDQARKRNTILSTSHKVFEKLASGCYAYLYVCLVAIYRL